MLCHTGGLRLCALLQQRDLMPMHSKVNLSQFLELLPWFPVQAWAVRLHQGAQDRDY